MVQQEHSGGGPLLCAAQGRYRLDCEGTAGRDDDIGLMGPNKIDRSAVVADRSEHCDVTAGFDHPD
ncbi:hypothetical protein ACFRAO_29900 [Streptomyces sp. NPDC056656]|uniref:hypothetical protein n=1 Tax=Streptomyces sp. NPDC056656 TaxID=3345895 RepID=UPI0036B77112